MNQNKFWVSLQTLNSNWKLTSQKYCQNRKQRMYWYIILVTLILNICTQLSPCKPLNAQKQSSTKPHFLNNRVSFNGKKALKASQDLCVSLRNSTFQSSASSRVWLSLVTSAKGILLSWPFVCLLALLLGLRTSAANEYSSLGRWVDLG